MIVACRIIIDRVTEFTLSGIFDAQHFGQNAQKMKAVRQLRYTLFNIVERQSLKNAKIVRNSRSNLNAQRGA